MVINFNIFYCSISVCVNNSECSELLTEWMKHLDEDAYNKKMDAGGKLPSVTKKIYHHADTNYWSSNIADEIQ